MNKQNNILNIKYLELKKQNMQGGSNNTLTTLALIQKIIPSGWAICDGTNGTPDLRGRFVLMAQDICPGADSVPGCQIHPIFSRGGEEYHVLTVDEMPSHTHITRGTGKWNTGGGCDNPYVTADGNGMGSTEGAGGNKSHNTMPPFYTLVYVMKL